MTPFEAPVFAKDATVSHLYQASCRRPRCEWGGPIRHASAEAYADRSEHLEEHRQRYKQQFQQDQL
jgi:hypothetical protein